MYKGIEETREDIYGVAQQIRLVIESLNSGVCEEDFTKLSRLASALGVCVNTLEGLHHSLKPLHLVDGETMEYLRDAATNELASTIIASRGLLGDGRAN